MAGGKARMTKQQVYETIRDHILFLDYRPGETLSDVKIAEELHVSRTPVREALLILQREKLVDIYPQSSTFVSLIDLDLIRETIYIRHILELDILQILLEKKANVRPKAERYLYLQSLAVDENNQREYVKNDHLFHQVLFEEAGHGMEWDIIYPNYQHTIRYHMLDFLDSDLIGTSLAEHRLILDYLEQSDYDQLKGIVDIHHDYKLRTSAHLIEKYPNYFVRP